VAVTTILDGTDYTSVVAEGSTTHQHNRPSFVSVKMPSHVAPASDPIRCKIVLDGGLDFHGEIVDSSDEGGTEPDDISTVFTFADPTLILEDRPCRDGAASGDPGDFSNPDFVQRNTTAPAMLREILEQSMTTDGPDGEGDLGFTLGTFATGGVDLRGAPVDWPMTIANFIALMAGTGELDVVFTPGDSGGSMGTLSAYNGNAGTDRSGSVHFQWATGDHSARWAKRTTNYRGLVNKLWIYLGPREKTSADPGALQHWAASITRTATPGYFPDPPYSTVESAILASRAAYRTRMLIRIFDARGNEEEFLELYKRWWLMESWTRARPQREIHVKPNVGIPPTFRTGDLIRVSAGAALRGGFSGVQRVMDYTYRWDDKGNVELGEPLAQRTAPALVVTDHFEGFH